MTINDVQGNVDTNVKIVQLKHGDWGKIAVVTRLEKMVENQFVVAWSHLITKGLRPGDSFGIVKDRTAHQAANEAVRGALQTDCDTFAFMDSDADFGYDVIEQLRTLPEGADYDALQAFYTRRGWPPEAIWFKRSELGDLMQCLVWKDNHTEEVALVGLHAVLIRRRVFEGMLAAKPDHVSEEDFDWFYYPRNKNVSEDAAFSEEATKLGYRLGATTAVKTGHISRVTTGWQTYQEQLELSGANEHWNHYYKLVEDVAEFTGEDMDTVIAKAVRGSQNVRDGLAAHDNPQRKDADTLREFYGADNNGYLYDLIAWNCSPGYKQIVAPLKEMSGQYTLVVGAGLGGEAEALLSSNRVDLFELPGILRTFLIQRYNTIHGVNIMLSSDTILDLWDSRKRPALDDGGRFLVERYNLIVAVDVLEHIHPDEFEQTLDAMLAMLRPGGAFYFHNNFGEQDKYPMHFDHSAAYAAWIEKNGLSRELSSEAPNGAEFVRRLTDEA